MKTSSILIICLSVQQLCSFSVSPQQTKVIAHKIWHNECNGSIQGLTTWNRGESCASLGIGHFIWYPKNRRGVFHETFPELLTFLQEKGVALPAWLAAETTCPWTSREEFYKEIQSKKMQELRTLLAATTNEQALFMANRFKKILPSLVKECSKADHAQITTVFNKLACTPQGLYALIDYHNFKGAGTDPKERYHNKGWGLKQVLLATKSSSPNITEAFSEAAKKTLAQRTRLAPKERNEKRWLPGWFNRINSYKTR